MKNIILTVAFSLLALALGVVIGRMTSDGQEEVQKPQAQKRSDISETRVKGSYKFVNPLLECDQAEPTLRASVKGLEQELKSYIAKSVSASEVEMVAVYYRDLNNGP